MDDIHQGMHPNLLTFDKFAILYKHNLCIHFHLLLH